MGADVAHVVLTWHTRGIHVVVEEWGSMGRVRLDEAFLRLGFAFPFAFSQKLPRGHGYMLQEAWWHVFSVPFFFCILTVRSGIAMRTCR